MHRTLSINDPCNKIELIEKSLSLRLLPLLVRSLARAHTLLLFLRRAVIVFAIEDGVAKKNSIRKVNLPSMQPSDQRRPTKQRDSKQLNEDFSLE